jgi:diguanylate cyclase (GGDEF)-like protein
VRALARLALTDALTGLGHRRTWDQQLSHELARARRSNEPLSVALLDLDDFKAFNDDHGHQAGDRLLIGVTSAWGSELRDVDVLCRWGGDKFAALLRDPADAVIARLAARTPTSSPALPAQPARTAGRPPTSCWRGPTKRSTTPNRCPSATGTGDPQAFRGQPFPEDRRHGKSIIDSLRTRAGILPSTASRTSFLGTKALRDGGPQRGDMGGAGPLGSSG